MNKKGHLVGAMAFSPLPVTLIGYQQPELTLACVAGLFAGASAPDYLEMNVIPHRTITHTLSLWLSVALYGAHCALLVPLPAFMELKATSKEIGAFLLGFGCAGIAHWIGDALNLKPVPVITPFDRVALKLFRSGEKQGFSCLFIFLVSLALTDLAKGVYL